VLNFGWDRKEIKKSSGKKHKAGDVGTQSGLFISQCLQRFVYVDKPGDDTTVAAIKIREKVKVNVMVGPPADKAHDDQHRIYIFSQLRQKGGLRGNKLANRRQTPG
jgi:hypothetical protein